MLAKGHPLSGCSCVRFDSPAVGHFAARFFLERHYTQLAFVGDVQDVYWSKERERAFRQSAEASGATCTVYPPPTASERRDWAVEQPRMQAWLEALPKPVALFTAMDGRARQVLDACMASGITVPNEVAVLGVDDDPFICEATFPTLSSIQTNGQQIGFLLAKHLDQLMHGKRPKKKTIWGTPTRIAFRRSTDASAIQDSQVARALEYIWREAPDRPLHVKDIVRLIGASRRFAEIHFKNVVGRTIMEEIRRVKLERVCVLLAETNRTVGDISRRCGFARESHLAFLFKKRFGLSMTRFRASSRERSTPEIGQ